MFTVTESHWAKWLSFHTLSKVSHAVLATPITVSRLALISNQLVWIASRCVDPTCRGGAVGEGLGSKHGLTVNYGIVLCSFSSLREWGTICHFWATSGNLGKKVNHDKNQVVGFNSICSRNSFVFVKRTHFVRNAGLQLTWWTEKWIQMSKNFAPYLLDVEFSIRFNDMLLCWTKVAKNNITQSSFNKLRQTDLMKKR